jgi:protease I
MRLEGKKVVMPVADLFEEPELIYPYYRLLEEGAEVVAAGKHEGIFEGKHGYPFKAKMKTSDLKVDDFDGVVIPGGYAPDKLRRDSHIVEFIRKMDEAGKLVATICHAGWMLAEADILKGRKVTSFFSIRADMVHAGADWVDESVVVDGNMITSRNPGDLPDFLREIIRFLESH